MASIAFAVGSICILQKTFAILCERLIKSELHQLQGHAQKIRLDAGWQDFASWLDFAVGSLNVEL